MKSTLVVLSLVIAMAARAERVEGPGYADTRPQVAGGVAPRTSNEPENPEQVKAFQSQLDKLDQRNEARIDETMSLIRSTGPEVGSYSRAQVALLAELGDQLKELVSRRERYRRLRAFLSTPNLHKFVDEPTVAFGDREPASEKADRIRTAGFVTVPSPKYFRHMSRLQLQQRLKELTELMGQQTKQWRQIESQLASIRTTQSKDDPMLKFVASIVTQHSNGWFVQSMLYTKYGEELDSIRASLGE